MTSRCSDLQRFCDVSDPEGTSTAAFLWQPGVLRAVERPRLSDRSLAARRPTLSDAHAASGRHPVAICVSTSGHLPSFWEGPAGE